MTFGLPVKVALSHSWGHFSYLGVWGVLGGTEDHNKKEPELHMKNAEKLRPSMKVLNPEITRPSQTLFERNQKGYPQKGIHEKAGFFVPQM